MIKCEGCNNEAKYIVYDQPHCQKCFEEAIECEEEVMVRKLDESQE